MNKKSVALVVAIIGGISAIIAAFIINNSQTDLKESIEINVENNGVIRDIIWTVTKIIPTQTEEQNSVYIGEHETKIIWFLRYRNNENYFEARNILFSTLSSKFKEEEMRKFHNNLTSIFIITDIEALWKVWVGNDFIVSKHLVTLGYSYSSIQYTDKVLFSVRGKISDKKETHLVLIKCYDDSVISPLCRFLSNKTTP